MNWDSSGCWLGLIHRIPFQTQMDWTNRIGDLTPDVNHRVAVIGKKQMQCKVSVLKSLNRNLLKTYHVDLNMKSVNY
jgi:hypothetical protein